LFISFRKGQAGRLTISKRPQKFSCCPTNSPLWGADAPMVPSQSKAEDPRRIPGHAKSLYKRLKKLLSNLISCDSILLVPFFQEIQLLGQRQKRLKKLVDIPMKTRYTY
ncbi:hypothetical protein, partial [Streptococcus anginosus]|uniref:hypothetical protein n=1 Tax=Streptococcus anginosus TaxID=1328 RepID=UPI0021F89F81